MSAAHWSYVINQSFIIDLLRSINIPKLVTETVMMDRNETMYTDDHKNMSDVLQGMRMPVFVEVQRYELRLVCMLFGKATTLYKMAAIVIVYNIEMLGPLNVPRPSSSLIYSTVNWLVILYG